MVDWTVIILKHIQQALTNLESILDKHGLKLRKNTKSPLPGNFHLEQDSTPEYDTENIRQYISLLGILRW